METDRALSITHLQTLIDIAVSVPIMMQNFDSVRQLSAQGSDDLSHSKNVNHLMAEALGVQEALDDWDTRFRGGDKKSGLCILRHAMERPEDGALGSIYPRL